MSNRILLLSFVLISSLAFAQTQSEAPCTSSVQGDLRLHQLTSKIFNNTRTIRVLVPGGYDAAQNKDRRYPVLYMLDGQNLFDVCTGFGHKEWQIDETIKLLTAAKSVPEMIVVGIDHGMEKRAFEYLPYKDFVGNPKMEEPGGKQFPDFLTDEVMPFVDGEYRTLKGHDNTGIGGSSYGGVAALYALMAKPSVFGYGILESPILWIGMGELVRDTNPFCAAPKKIFMAFGGKEIDNELMQRRILELVHQVEANLKQAGYNNTSLKVVIDPETKHNEEAWGKRFPEAMKFLYGDWKPGEGPTR
jgi:predicted alpha/beta superfamily hydrolase